MGPSIDTGLSYKIKGIRTASIAVQVRWRTRRVNWTKCDNDTNAKWVKRKKNTRRRKKYVRRTRICICVHCNVIGTNGYKYNCKVKVVYRLIVLKRKILTKSQFQSVCCARWQCGRVSYSYVFNCVVLDSLGVFFYSSSSVCLWESAAEQWTKRNEVTRRNGENICRYMYFCYVLSSH